MEARKKPELGCNSGYVANTLSNLREYSLSTRAGRVPAVFVAKR
jgi:hypothetical protein